MEDLKALNKLRIDLKRSEQSLLVETYCLNNAKAKLLLIKNTRKRKKVEKTMFAIIDNL